VVPDLKDLDVVIDDAVAQDAALVEFFVAYPLADDRLKSDALKVKEAIRQSLKGVVLERSTASFPLEAGWPYMTHLVALPSRDGPSWSAAKPFVFCCL
jgi:hypothetical protein